MTENPESKDPIDYLLKKLQEVDPAAAWRRIPWPFLYKLETLGSEFLVHEVTCFPSQGIWIYEFYDLRTEPVTFIRNTFSNPDDVIQHVSSELKTV